MSDESQSPAVVLASCSVTEKKWASFVLLGPLLPTMFAIILIVIGGAIVKNPIIDHVDLHWRRFRRIDQADNIDDNADIACGYPIDIFIKAAIGNSYFLLVVFSWSFLGFEAHFSIRGRRRRFLWPFSSLAFVAQLYLLIFIASVAMVYVYSISIVDSPKLATRNSLAVNSRQGVVNRNNPFSYKLCMKNRPPAPSEPKIRWSFGTWAVLEDRATNTCATTVPVLYVLAEATVVTYWVGVFFGLVAVVRKSFEEQIKSSEQACSDKGKKYTEGRDREKQLVGSKFDAYDKDGVGAITRVQAESLIEGLGLGLSSETLTTVMARLDPGEKGMVFKDDLLQWRAESDQLE